ncbi:hypothetical protein TNCV_2865301 [Trichonephila clavipes]|nr:hypothetical protein TNCV_2865301 [Trichonephila clavipes]
MDLISLCLSGNFFYPVCFAYKVIDWTSRHRISKQHGGRVCLVVKVTDSWLACHEFQPSTAENPTCRGRGLKCHPVGVMWKLGEEGNSSDASLPLAHGSKLRDSSPRALE